MPAVRLADIERRSPAEILALIRELGVTPTDPWQLVALLEMQGWSDEKAREYGYRDLFDLADQLQPQIASEMAHVTAEYNPPRPWYYWLGLRLWQFFRGLVFAMPMIISCLATLLVGISLWAYVGFGVPEATGIALGTIGSFLATGGFTQAIARRGLFFIEIKEYRLARYTAMAMVRAGVWFTLALGAGVALVLFFFPVLRWSTIRMSAIYYPFLSIIWLELGLLYMLQRELAFTGVVTAGIAIAYVTYRSPLLAGLGPIGAVVVAHVTALCFTAAASGLLAHWVFRSLERRADASPSEVHAVRWSVVGRRLFPYWLYGFLFFGSFFVDRLMAWSVPHPVILYPQMISFVGPYEFGLNFAAIAMVLPMGWVELGIHALNRTFYQVPAEYKATQTAAYNRRVIRQWGWLQAALGAMAIPGIVGVYILLQWLAEKGYIITPTTLPVTTWVYLWGSVGFLLLSGALFNVLILFSTSRPWQAVRAVAAAAYTDLTVSFLASRYWYHCFNPGGCADVESMLRYPQAVMGFVAGGAVFWLVAAAYTHRLLSHTDYVLYTNT